MLAAMPTFLWIWVLASLPDTPVEPAVVVLERHCGSCHDGALPTAKAPALRVFNLRDPDFVTRVSDDRLGKIIGRIDGSSASKDEKRTIVEWIDGERQRRAR
jgi:hypothetical protein